MADEDNSLTGRLGRYARVGVGMGGVVARVAGERYLGLKVDRGRHAADLKAALGGLKGPLMKAAQLLSTIPDALPEEYVAELSQLQSNAPSMGWPFVKRRMTSELGPTWQTRFASFEREAAAAASLGQVHRATSLSGAALACKLQYPDMRSTLEADLGQLKLLFSLYQRYDSAIRTEEIHAELAARLREELDYRREAKHMALFADMLRDEANVQVPTPVAELSTERLLTMNWLSGEKLMNFVEAPQERRNRLAETMFRAWYVPLYRYGAIHGDPHLGNYSVRPDTSVNLLDFGCVRIFPPKFVKGSIDLYWALLRGDEALAVSAYEDWGFTGLSREMIAVLNQWAHFIYGPLMDDRPRRLAEGTAGRYGRETAQKVHAEIRRLGGVTPPREFVFMDRAAIGLGSVFIHLKAELNWMRLFQSLVDGFEVGQLAQRQGEALRAAGLTPAI
jgi:predicted unusual protein kinase regulating ubiquinone biosynthesis (AarF/ABC1/UbiB family)